MKNEELVLGRAGGDASAEDKSATSDVKSEACQPGGLKVYESLWIWFC